MRTQTEKTNQKRMTIIGWIHTQLSEHFVGRTIRNHDGEEFVVGSITIEIGRVPPDPDHVLDLELHEAIDPERPARIPIPDRRDGEIYLDAPISMRLRVTSEMPEIVAHVKGDLRGSRG